MQNWNPEYIVVMVRYIWKVSTLGFCCELIQLFPVLFSTSFLHLWLIINSSVLAYIPIRFLCTLARMQTCESSLVDLFVYSLFCFPISLSSISQPTEPIPLGGYKYELLWIIISRSPSAVPIHCAQSDQVQSDSLHAFLPRPFYP